MIQIGRDLAGGLSLEADVCVIGSGAGGAVTAAELARAGRRVVVLEEGGYYVGGDFTQREDEMYPMLYRDGGGQATLDLTISVLQGSCVGGSTVVNMADCERIPEGVLAHWARVFRVEGLDARSLEASYARVEKALNVNRIEEKDHNRANRLLLEGARKLGYAAQGFRHNRTNCVGSGYCLVGCTYDAKRSAALNYIPEADRLGARILADVRADRIRVEGGRVRGVVARVLDRATRRPVAPVEVRAPRVVVAAGAVHTPLLLKRSGIGHPALGKNLSLQPQGGVVAVYREEVKAFRGIPQSAFVAQFEEATEERGLGGWRVEGVSGGPSMAATLLGGFGALHRDRMKKFAHVAAALVLVPDRPSGSVGQGWDGRPAIRYAPTEEWGARFRKGLRTAAEAYLASGAERVFLPFETPVEIRSPADLDGIARLPLRTAEVRLLSAHPQGTCRMGEDPKTSVVDSAGRVRGVEGLSIADASVFPTTAATHTMIPIMAVADWMAHQRPADP